MKKVIIFGLLLTLMFASLGFAQNLPSSYISADNPYQSGVMSRCINNNTAIENSLTVYRCVDNSCNYIVANATHACQYGCNYQVNPNSCNPAPFQVNIMLLIAGIFIILLFAGFIMWAKGH